ncbi:hypothetical protein [Pseudarthrobacter sp. DSP2-3-2b1]|uniref:hypothetical protein n=1 Tax=Pseudarthrobacter sp. DSP2-3-2b1 TaxID=2804661 RepID=UPI003CF58470
MALLPVRRSLDVQWDVAPKAAHHAVELPEDPTATLELTVQERVSCGLCSRGWPSPLRHAAGIFGPGRR